MTKLVDLAKEKEENVKVCNILSAIVNQECKGTILKASQPYPNQIPLFYLYETFSKRDLKSENSIIRFLLNGAYKLHDSLKGMFIDGGPPYPHIKVRDNNYLDFAKGIAEIYQKETGIEMTIEYAS